MLAYKPDSIRISKNSNLILTKKEMCQMKMSKWMLVILMLIIFVLISRRLPAAEKKADIYHEGWIDLNKNGQIDP